MRTTALAFAEDAIWEGESPGRLARWDGETGESPGRLARWDAETGEQTSLWDTEWVLSSVAFQSDERWALVGGYPRDATGARTPDPALKQMDLTTGRTRWTTSLPVHPDPIFIAPDGARCLVPGQSLDREDYGLAYIDTASGALVWQVWGLPRMMGADFFPDGKRIAETTFNAWDNTLFIRDSETGEVLKRFTGHAQPAMLDISPDGSRIVTGNWDGTISLWSPERGEILALPAHAGPTTDVGFSPDGETIASLGDDGLRRLWSAVPVEQRDAARRAAARRRRWSVDARRRVDALLSTRVHAEAVVAALKADRSLDQEQRDAAILMVRSEGSEPKEVVGRSVARPLQPGSQHDAYS